MPAVDRNLEWLGHVQPVGLVVAPAILRRYGLEPEEQRRADGEEIAALLDPDDERPALADPWALFETILGWNAKYVAGAPGGPDLPEDLSVHLPEGDTTLAPNWAVVEPDGGWQMLVRLEEAGVDPDKRGALDGWEATPQQRMERLLRETGVPTGLLITDRQIRLIHAPRGETSGWLAFPIRDLATVGGRPMLGGLKLLLNKHRLFADSAERRLPGLLRASREAQAEVSAKLATQVLGALHELLRGLHAADRERIEHLAKERPGHLYEGLLTVLLRLVFLLYAEDRALIPSRTDGPSRQLYDEGYGVRTLHARLLGDKARHPDTMDERRGGWGRLLALFRLVHAGGDGGWIRGRGGKLFDPAEFPFLEGRDAAADRPRPAAVSDGCILRILDGLLVLGGEKLSYRTLDVEQIGSVYETVMGFTVTAMRGRALAIKAGKNNRTPVFVDLDALTALKGKAREKHLKEEADRGQLPARVASALAAAEGADEVAAALGAIVDERGSPFAHPAPAGAPLLQPTDERRRTGSHYTPRTLTEPIVRHALEPAFARIGEDATPEDVLALKVCDPAMGSGAFLAEACRQLAARLARAWARWPGTRPPIPEDEDEDLLARRLIAQRCLYGVDRNPMATDLARLSLWLATLARDHEFTFLDHALKSGDSLVGLSVDQIASLTWSDDRQTTFATPLVRQRLAEAREARREIREAPDDVERSLQEQRHRALEARMEAIRTLGDATLAIFFEHEKPRAREAARRAFASLLNAEELWTEAGRLAPKLAHGPHPVRPFHWALEFPEAFGGDAGGFDAIVGNPPFVGGSIFSGSGRKNVMAWLLSAFSPAHGKSDLVAFFFRRAFEIVRPQGSFGFLATKTIREGFTRFSGLEFILDHGGSVYRAVRRRKWPGEAAVIVAEIHVKKGLVQEPELDGRRVDVITSFLLPFGSNRRPPNLSANSGIVYSGLNPNGSGFVLDSEQMNSLVEREPQSRKLIHPYLSSNDLNGTPHAGPSRWIIDVGHLNEGELANFPVLYQHMIQTVKAERANKKEERLSQYWWRYSRPAAKLQVRLVQFDRVLAMGRHATHHTLAFQSPSTRFSDATSVFLSESCAFFAVMQSSAHEMWAKFIGSALKDDPRYIPEDCFETFPFPRRLQEDASLEGAGERYHQERADAILARGEGMTKTYNRFHDPIERAEDIRRLRDLHHQLDLAVLRAYGWDDLAERAAPEHLTEETEPDHRYQGRLFWPAPFRDDVLARLLDLNRERAAEERALGLTAHAPDPNEEEDADDAFSLA